VVQASEVQALGFRLQDLRFGARYDPELGLAGLTLGDSVSIMVVYQHPEKLNGYGVVLMLRGLA
jgi:hypothetical protein